MNPNDNLPLTDAQIVFLMETVCILYQDLGVKPDAAAQAAMKAANQSMNYDLVEKHDRMLEDFKADLEVEASITDCLIEATYMGYSEQFGQS